MANKHYLIKLTPNNKEVIVDTNILKDGYDEVLFPINVIDTEKSLKYVLDTDTFKFVDSLRFNESKRPYPIKLELTCEFAELPFYGVNNAKNADKIIYEHIGQIVPDNVVLKAGLRLIPSDDNTYDEGTFSNINSGYNPGVCYYAQYKIYIKLYWSDNKSHSNDIDWETEKINGPEGVKPLVVRITDINSRTELLLDNSNIVTVPDNYTTSYIDAIKFNVDATYTDPETGRSVYAYTNVTVKQQPYLGYKKGYIHVKFRDTTPLEVYTPILDIFYAQSKDEEANVKVDKKSYTEYFAFKLDSTFTVDKAKYTYPGLFHTDAVDVIDTDGEHNYGIFKYDDVELDNFCLNNLSNKSLANLDETVFSDLDAKQFKTVFDNYVECANIENSSIFAIPRDDVSITNKKVSITLDKKLVIILGEYKARYSRFIIYNNMYYLYYNGKYYYDSNSKEPVNINYIDLTTEPLPANVDSSVISVDEKYIYDYAITTDNDGNAVLYKYCVNSLLDPLTVLLPRYGVYPVLSGYVAMPFEVYDFESDSLIPVCELTENEGLMYKQNGTLSVNIQKLKEVLTSKSGLDYRPVEIAGGYLTWSQYITSINTVDNIVYSAARSRMLNTPIMYGASPVSLNNISEAIKPYISVNGNSDIFTLSLTQYPFNVSKEDCIFDIDVNGIDFTVLVTNDDNEKHFKTYGNEGKPVNTKHSSSMLLRANPKLSGNIKLVVDSNYNLYLDTFKANNVLNDKRYRKFPIPADGNYPRDIKRVFKDIPVNNLFAVNSNSLKVHKVYHDFNDQFETMYEYGAETNTDSLYSENMKILAPLHIGDNVPEFFAIFRYDDVNKNNFSDSDISDVENLKNMIAASDVVKTYDLRTYTSIGQYLNNYKDMLSNYGLCYLQFIEQDNDIHSPMYRQGNNIWKGISISRGILVDLSETTYFGSKILNSDAPNKQELFNNYIIQGFERHGLIYPNIINLEFMFNDNSMDEYSMHRYFGLYLTANEFIRYKYIIQDSENGINIQKYDINGNIYSGDDNIYNVIFNKKYSDRLFFSITDNNVSRIKNNIDLNSFLTKYVINKPCKNILSVDANELGNDKLNKSFITLHLSKPLHYGEHIKFIALNYTDNNYSYTNISNEQVVTQTNIVYEIIASNDERLINTDNNISPYVNVNDCAYSENTCFYRLSFYSQNINYPEVSASISEQLERIAACVKKFDTFISVASLVDNTISIVSDYDEVYLQHIDSPVINEFKYDYLNFSDNINENSVIYTTNKEYTDSISFIPHSIINTDSVSIYEQVNDSNKNEHLLCDSNITGKWHCYIETLDPSNIKVDHISYFNENIKYNMYALSNHSEYFDNYYTAFSNYGFETLGWRYNTVVKFIKLSDNSYTYELHRNINDIASNIKFPLVYNNVGIYDTVNMFDILHGYVFNNIIPELKNNQKFIFDNINISAITYPYNVRHSIIITKNISLHENNKILIYEPVSANISIMGISKISDINTTVDLDDTVSMKTNLTVTVNPNESIKTDESDYRIQHGVMYEITEGTIIVSSFQLYAGIKFIIVGNKLYSSNSQGIGLTILDNIIIAKTLVRYSVIDRQGYQMYNYSTNIPKLNSDNYYIDITNTLNSELSYPVVPSVYCSWKSTGLYFDFNNILDVNTLNNTYIHKGSFAENIYTPSDYSSNQYISNKIDNIVYVNGECMTYKECILNNKLPHAIKKLLIDHKNIDSASAYYNSNIKSLEFVFNGIKYTIKLNSKIVNSHIYLDDFSGYEAFVMIDYDKTKKNEIYFSINEKFILLVNHQYYIDKNHEAANNIKDLNPLTFKGYVDYSAFQAPYSIDFSTIITDPAYTRASKQNNIHESLMSAIDKHNLWNSKFVLYDTNRNFICAQVEGMLDMYDYVTVKSCNYIPNTDNIPYHMNENHSYVLTKADIDILKESKNILQNINDKLGITDSDVIYTNNAGIDINLNTNITDNLLEANLTLQAILNTNIIHILKDNEDGTKTNKTISTSILRDIKQYIKKLLYIETPKEKLNRYVKTFTNDIDIYVIPNNSEYKHIASAGNNNILLFDISIPKMIKFNYGWFTLATNTMMDFYVNDELSDIIGIDLMLANTKIKDLYRLNNYAGNKVFNDNSLLTLNTNFFYISEKSLLSTTWDSNYYRLYTDEEQYTYEDGHKTGIDDKSFFGSRCMVIHNEYISIDRWKYETANDIYTISRGNSLFNTGSSNYGSISIRINLTSAIYNHFLNNKAFVENWNYFRNSLYTGIKNYINNTLLTYYNINSKIEVDLYAYDTDGAINIENIRPVNFSEYYKYENYQTKIETINDLSVLVITLNESTGKRIYPVLKIYKR